MIDRNADSTTTFPAWNPLAYLVSAVLLLNLLVAGLVGASLFHSRAQYQASARSATQNLARTLDEYLSGSFATVDAVLDSVDRAYQQQLAAPSFNAEMLDRHIKAEFSHLSFCESLYITDADGIITQGTSLPVGARISVADRAYFQKLKADPAIKLAISEPVLGKISGKWVVIFAKRVSKSDGSFAGVAFAAIALGHFYEVFAGLDVGLQGSVHLRDAELGLVVTYPIANNLEVGSKTVSKELRSSLETNPSSATFFTPTSYDGTPRMTTYRRLAVYPFYVIVAIAKREYLKPWFEQAFQFAALMGVFFFSTLWLSWLAYRKWRRQIAATLELDRHRNHLEELVTERTLEANRAREMAEAANHAKSVFLANMSHELRTPLNAILGFSEMISRNPETPDALKEKVAIINRSGEHLLSMINDVLDLSKIEAGKLAIEAEAIDLPALIEDLARMFEVRADAAGLRFNMELAPDAAHYISVDGKKLRQVLINLLGNAVKFTREGGFALRVRTLPVAGDPSRLRLHLEVQDSGPGIPAEQQQNLFKPFVQLAATASAQKGTGLGLSISKSLVELMGGTIGVDSTPGQGALFWVELPVMVAEDAPPLLASSGLEVARLAPDQPVWRILVVEDNPDNRLLLVSLLDAAGFEVREAENGEEAVALFTQWQPHLIWMDMRMPVLDGYQATRRIRALPGGDQVKIVAITASVFKEQHTRILEAGCDAVVHKPFRNPEIFEAMAKQLGVCYSYRQLDSSRSPAAVLLEVGVILAVEELNPSLRLELIEAAQQGDQERFEAALNLLEPRQDRLSAALRLLSEDFRYDKILVILGNPG